MADTELNIKLRLIDNISKILTNVENGMKSLHKTSDNLGRALKDTGRELSQLGSKFALIGGAITAPLILGFRSAAQSSLKYADTMDRLQSVQQRIAESIASSLQPVIERLAKILQAVLDQWESLTQAQRDTIVQTTFMVGVFLTLGGVFLKILGAILNITVALFKFIAVLTSVNAGLAIVVGSLILMIVYWDKVKAVAIPVLNGMEIAIGAVEIGFLKLQKTYLIVLAEIAEKFTELNLIMAQPGSPLQKQALALREVSAKFQAELAGMGQTADREIKAIEEKIAGIFAGKDGAIVTSIENVGDVFAKVMEFMSRATSVTLKNVQKEFKFMESIAKQVGDGMRRAFDDGFFNIMKGRFDSLKDVAINFGDSVLRAISGALSQLFLLNTIGKMPFFAGVFHTGGMIKKAHSGTINRDEQLILARSGEGVLNPQAMSNLGEDNFNALNRGGKLSMSGGKGITINVFQSISAWDATDVFRNRKVLAEAVGAEISTNQAIRDVIKRNT